MDWDELRRRVLYLRALYRGLRIELPPGEGLAQALDEAEALARGMVSAAPPTDENAARTAHDAHVIWMLQENIVICLDHGLELRAHLANIATGSTDFGTSTQDNRRIYFKDFEYEVFIMAMLLRAGRAVSLAPDPNDPICEFECDGLPCQLKHPNSPRRTERNLRRFNGQLRDIGRHGIFVVGIEDMFGLADGGIHGTPEAFDGWMEAKRVEMEEYGIPLLQRALRLSHVVGLVQTQTLVEFKAGNAQLRRLSNSSVMDRPGARQSAWWDCAMEVLRCFNPDPVLASSVANVDADDEGEEPQLGDR